MENQSAITFFISLLDCMGNISLWKYHHSFQLLSPPAEYMQAAESLLFSDSQLNAALYQCRAEKKALLFSESNSLSLLLVPDLNSDSGEIYLLGPVFYSGISESSYMTKLRSTSSSSDWKLALTKSLEHIPVISLFHFLQYGVILYKCINNKKIVPQDISFFTKPQRKKSDFPNIETTKSHSSYAFELRKFKAIEDGNIYYQDETFMGNTGVMALKNPLRQAKNEMIIMIALAERAALRGGLDEELAFSLGDYYIQLVEAASEINEVYSIGTDFVKDVTLRVHKNKLQHGISFEIQRCMFYIDEHLCQKFDISELAKQIGFSKNHLASKFKQETGQTIHNYVLSQRIQYAKALLNSNTEYSIEDIAAMLCFSSSSHFGSTFKKIMGISPSEYRFKHI